MRAINIEVNFIAILLFHSKEIFFRYGYFSNLINIQFELESNLSPFIRLIDCLNRDGVQGVR